MASQPVFEAQQELPDLLGIKHLSPSSDVVFTSKRRDPSPVGSPISPTGSDSLNKTRLPFSPFPPRSEYAKDSNPRNSSNNGNTSPSLQLFSSWNPVLDPTSISNEEADLSPQYDAWVDTWFGGMELSDPKPSEKNEKISSPQSGHRQLSPEPKKEKRPSIESQNTLASNWSGVEFKPSSPPFKMDLNIIPPYEDRSRPRTRFAESAPRHTQTNNPLGVPTRQRATSEQFHGPLVQGRQRSATTDGFDAPPQLQQARPGYGYSRSHDSSLSLSNFVAFEESMKQPNPRRTEMSASPRLVPPERQGLFTTSSGNLSPSPRQRSLSPHGHEQPKYRRKSKGKNHGTFHGNRKDPEMARYDLDVSKVISGEEIRTTLMVKNIPNKYSQEMLLEAIDDQHKGLYDFFYLPIDFKNKCNVGYAFINFIDPLSIPSFYAAFNQKKWLKFNSSKVCKITYARIQGKIAFIEHFRNSSLMHEDPKCRPLIFYSAGPHLGLAEPFPIPSSQYQRRSDGESGFDFDEEDTSDPSP